MATSAFAGALSALIRRAETHVVAVMCSESLWWRCHRRLIADAAVLLHAAEVAHLFHDGRIGRHEPAAEARVQRSGNRAVLVYDGLASPDPGGTRTG